MFRSTGSVQILYSRAYHDSYSCGPLVCYYVHQILMLDFRKKFTQHFKSSKSVAPMVPQTTASACDSNLLAATGLVNG